MKRFPGVTAWVLGCGLWMCGNGVAAPADAGPQLTVNCAKKNQTIVGLGTCGMHWTGGDLYANKQVQDLYVKDLGASILRVGLPPGVLPHEIADPKDISYHQFQFSDAGTKAAMDYVAAIYAANPREMTVITSVWSPPGWMKTNGKTGHGGQLRPDRIEHYAKYLTEWVRYFQEVHQVPISYVSIQNELVFVEPYDSCTYKPDMFAKTVLATGEAFKAAKLGAKIFGPEHMTWAVDDVRKFVEPVLRDPAGKQYLAAVATHGYVDGVQPSGTAEENAKLWKILKPLGVQWWMSETSGESTNFVAGVDKKGKPKAGAFALGSRIHNALVYGNASAWVYWCFSGHSKKPDDAAAAEALMNGVQPTKKYYVSKQFYRYIRPGAVRVDCGPDGEDQLQASAYLHEKNGSLTVVLLNHATAEKTVTLDLKSAPLIRSFAVYRTSASEDCVPLDALRVQGGKTVVTLPAQSVVTLYGAGN